VDKGPTAAVVFDWDGTLVDSKRVLVEAFRASTGEVLGSPYPSTHEETEMIVQLRGEDAFALLAGGDPELAARLAEAFHPHYVSRAAGAEPFPGTLETLERLRAAGLKIGVATSKARVRLDLEAERTGIGAFLDAEISGDEVTAAKPDPECVVEVIRRLGVEPERTLFVGDGPNDVLAGKAAGAITVAVSFGFHPEEARAAAPDHVIDAMAELPALAGLEAD
jgi:HAD superfamily hydrolase (TIGR01509 family)